MNLKHKSITYVYVEYQDLESFLRNEFKIPKYSLADDLCLDSYSEREIEVTDDILSEYEESLVLSFKDDGDMVDMAGILLQKLCNQRKIIAATYMITTKNLKNGGIK